MSVKTKKIYIIGSLDKVFTYQNTFSTLNEATEFVKENELEGIAVIYEEDVPTEQKN